MLKNMDAHTKHHSMVLSSIQWHHVCKTCGVLWHPTVSHCVPMCLTASHSMSHGVLCHPVAHLVVSHCILWHPPAVSYIMDTLGMSGMHFASFWVHSTVFLFIFYSFWCSFHSVRAILFIYLVISIDLRLL